MDIQSEINWIQTELKKVTDPQLIMAFKNLLNYRNSKETDWSDELDAEEKAAIEEGLAQIERGEYVSHKEVQKKIKDRFNF